MSDRLTQAQQRLQEMVKDYQPLVSAQSVREQRAEIRARADACELGAQCVALVQRLAAIELPHVAVLFPPILVDNDTGRLCRFCGSDSNRAHGTDCLWQQARQLTEGER